MATPRKTSFQSVPTEMLLREFLRRLNKSLVACLDETLSDRNIKPHDYLVELIECDQAQRRLEKWRKQFPERATHLKKIGKANGHAERAERILTLADEGIGSSAIAERVDLSLASVDRILRENGR